MINIHRNRAWRRFFIGALLLVVLWIVATITIKAQPTVFSWKATEIETPRTGRIQVYVVETSGACIYVTYYGGVSIASSSIPRTALPPGKGC